jgi:hypothetical protein
MAAQNGASIADIRLGSDPAEEAAVSDVGAAAFNKL